MFTAKVTGMTWATIKSPSLEGVKMLLIRRLNPLTGELQGKTMMAVDSKIGAGPGDIVLIIDEGGSARQSLALDNAPIRTAVVGIVDEITANGQSIKYH